jgi:hypothetical protein
MEFMGKNSFITKTIKNRLNKITVKLKEISKKLLFKICKTKQYKVNMIIT